MFIKQLFMLKNYTVTRAHLEYISPPKKSVGWNSFWQSVERYWGEEEEPCYEDVTKCWKSIGVPPSGVKNAVLILEYEYDGKDYECVTKNMNIKWPPESKGAQFSLPIINVMLMDENGPVRDVTIELKKKMGPRKDFHGEKDLLVEDLFEWNDYTHVMVKNALNNVKTVHKTSNCLELL